MYGGFHMRCNFFFFFFASLLSAVLRDGDGSTATPLSLPPMQCTSLVVFFFSSSPFSASSPLLSHSLSHTERERETTAVYT